MKKGQNFYRRDPAEALSGMVGLTLEERGVYNTVLDLLYSTWRPLEDNRAFIAGWCGCAVQRLNPIIRRLIEAEKLITFVEGGRTYLSNPAFERERAAVKGPAKTRSGRAEVEEKSGEVGQKSAGVGENHPTSENEKAQNQGDTRLDREEKSRIEETPLPPEGGRRKPKRSIPEGFPDDAAVADQQAKAREAGVNLDIGNQAERFRNWAAANDARYADWNATWRNWCDRAITSAPKTAMASASVRSIRPDDDAWRKRLREFKGNGYWPIDDAGPRPGQPGCRAPAAILAEFGFSPAPANDTPLFGGEAVA